MSFKEAQMIMELPQMQNFAEAVVNGSFSNQAEMEAQVSVYNYEMVDEGGHQQRVKVKVPPAAWGFTYDDVVGKTSAVDQMAMDEFRKQRNERLAECDFVTLRAYSQGVPVPTEWATYQQQLRDLPDQQTATFGPTGDLVGVTWPAKPVL